MRNVLLSNEPVVAKSEGLLREKRRGEGGIGNGELHLVHLHADRNWNVLRGRGGTGSDFHFVENGDHEGAQSAPFGGGFDSIQSVERVEEGHLKCS